MPEIQWLSLGCRGRRLDESPSPHASNGGWQLVKSNPKENDDGQVQVLVTVPDTVEPVSSEAFETVRELANQQVDIAAGSASALVRVAQEQAMRAENQLLLARQDAGRYRKEMQMAMGLVACILLMVILAVGWCTHDDYLTCPGGCPASVPDNAARLAEEARICSNRIIRTRTRSSWTPPFHRHAPEPKAELAAYKTRTVGRHRVDASQAPDQPATDESDPADDAGVHRGLNSVPRNNEITAWPHNLE